MTGSVRTKGQVSKVMRIQPKPPTTDRTDVPAAPSAPSAAPASSMPADALRVSRGQAVGGASAPASADAARVVVDAAQKMITDAPLRALAAQGNALPDDVRRLLN
jgi:hypothetical protein